MATISVVSQVSVDLRAKVLALIGVLTPDPYITESHRTPKTKSLDEIYKGLEDGGINFTDEELGLVLNDLIADRTLSLETYQTSQGCGVRLVRKAS